MVAAIPPKTTSKSNGIMPKIVVMVAIRTGRTCETVDSMMTPILVYNQSVIIFITYQNFVKFWTCCVCNISCALFTALLQPFQYIWQCVFRFLTEYSHNYMLLLFFSFISQRSLPCSLGFSSIGLQTLILMTVELQIRRDGYMEFVSLCFTLFFPKCYFGKSKIIYIRYYCQKPVSSH